MKNFKQYILTGLLLMLSALVMASPVKFKTNKAIGDNLTIAINSGVEVSVVWNNGQSETFVSDGCLKTLKIKDQGAEVNVDQALTSLYLGGNGITELTFDVTAYTLKQLYCPGNALTTLDLSACQQLVQLNCQNNQLRNIVIGSEMLEVCDLSNNQLKQISLPDHNDFLQTLVLSGNQIENLEGIDQMKNLQNLFAAHNKLTDVSLKKNSKMRNIVVNNNALTRFYSSALNKVQQVWISHNQLEQLDLSDASQLVGVKADNNQLNNIKWTKNCSSTFKFIDVTGNKLFYNSLPTIYNPEKKEYSVEAYIMPQQKYFLSNYFLERVTYKEKKDILTKNGWGEASLLQTTFIANDTLQSPADYTYNDGEFRFSHTANGVSITAKSENYPGISLTTDTFEVRKYTRGTMVFNFVYNGKSIGTEQKDYEFGSVVDALPTLHEKDFCTYEFKSKVLEKDVDTIDVKVVWNGPFEFSDSFENASWYYLTINASYKLVGYLHHVDNNPITLTTQAGGKDYYWAFLGDPFHIQIVNLSQGNRKYLNNTSNYPSMTEGKCSWSIHPANVSAGKFHLYNEKCGYTNFVKPWLKYSSQFPKGSHIVVMKAPVIDFNYTEKVAEEIAPFFDAKHIGHYFEINQETYDTYKEQVAAAKNTCDQSTYTKLKDVLYKNIKLPSDGFYRFKNVATNGYLHANTASILECNDNTKNLQTVVEIRSVLPPGTYYNEKKPFLRIQDQWCSNCHKNNTPGLLNEKANFINYLPIAPGKFAFAIAHFNARPGYEEQLPISYYTATANATIEGSKDTPKANDDASIWTIEEATHAEVDLQNIGVENYGTLYAPFAVSIANGSAGTVTLENETGKLNIIEGIVPSHTPVVVVSKDAKANVTIHPDNNETTTAPNILKGIFLPSTTTADRLFLGQQDAQAGFFPWEGTTTAANQAYVPTDVAPATGFLLDDTSTGINGITCEKGTQIYDLQGRKVTNPRNGVYIINNHKVFFK